MVCANLEPKKVFEIFEELCAIPHPSDHEEKIADYLEQFARSRHLECHRDSVHNVIIIKEASAGREGEEPLIIQGHTDMVCEQDPGRNIDFMNEGLDLEVKDGYLTARGTTLGGDDGIAVAYALALLDDDTISHPRLEVVLTTSEEIGMGGAQAVDLSLVKGKRLVNIDSDEEGHILTGCAGGCRVDGKSKLETRTVSGLRCSVILKGLAGGHSGMEIVKGGANACKALNHVLLELKAQTSFALLSMEGGNKDNAIPLEAAAQVVIAERQVPMVVAALKRSETALLEQFGATDPGLKLELHPGETGTFNALADAECGKVLNLLERLPNGVQAMSRNIEGLVETSLNLGVLRVSDQGFWVRFSLRSSVEQSKEELKARVLSILNGADVMTSTAGDYPSWEFREISPLRDALCRSYEKLYGEKPQIEAIHAGLECGLFSQKLPGMDAVSFGPNMLDIHTTRERMEIASVERVWRLLLELVEHPV